MNKYFLSILTVLLLNSLAMLNAEDKNYRPGYIITNENDTVYGEIDFRTATLNAQVCHFRTSISDVVRQYKPGDIYAYRFTDDGKFYVTRTIPLGGTPQKVFLEYLVKGIINLYYYRAPTTIRYFFEDENGRFIEIYDQERLVKVDSITGYFKDRRYIGVMTVLFRQSDKIKKELHKIRLNRNDLSKITKEYHYEVCRTGEECIEFEFKPDVRYLHIGFMLSAGVRTYCFRSNAATKYWAIQGITADNINSVFPSIVAQANFLIPRLTNYVSLQLEAELGKLKGENILLTEHTYNRFKINTFLTDIRAGLCFRLSKTRIYPTIGGGFCDSFFWNTDASNLRIIEVDGKEYTEGINFSDETSKNYIGFYVNAGIVFPLKKSGAIVVQGLMEQRKKSGDELSTWGGSIGYRF